MGKSVTATLLGVLIKQGVYKLPAAGADSRVAGAGRPAREDPHRRPPATCRAACASARRRIPTTIRPARIPDHLYLYTGSVDSFQYAATRPLQWPPGTVGRYRNTDPVLVNYLVRLARREARRGIPVVPAARALRPHRHPDDGAGDRSVRELPAAGLRARLGARLGAARQPVPAGRRVERRARSCPRVT